MAEPNRRRTVTASEIGQFTFCEKSWELQRNGGASLTPEMIEGKEEHEREAARVEAFTSQMPPFRRQEVDWSPMSELSAPRRRRWDWTTVAIIALSPTLVAILAVIAGLFWSRLRGVHIPFIDA